MQTSSRALSKDATTTILEQLFTVLAHLNHPQKVESFCRAFFSDTELMVFAKRLAILNDLAQSKSYEEIKDRLNVSSATISNVSETKEQAGAQVALQLLRLDRWAQKLLHPLRKS